MGEGLSLPPEAGRFPSALAAEVSPPDAHACCGTLSSSTGPDDVRNGIQYCWEPTAPQPAVGIFLPRRFALRVFGVDFIGRARPPTRISWQPPFSAHLLYLNTVDLVAALRVLAVIARVYRGCHLEALARKASQAQLVCPIRLGLTRV